MVRAAVPERLLALVMNAYAKVRAFFVPSPNGLLVLVANAAKPS